jgi:uncharacterized repeat protein (TIGR02543 family)
MSAIGARHPRRTLLVCVLPALLALMTFGAGVARAGGCDLWKGSAGGDWNSSSNWSLSTVPDANTCVQIPGTGTGPVLISGESVTAESIQLTGAELDIEGTPSHRAVLTLSGNNSASSAIDSSSKIVLESSCTALCTSGITSTLTISTGTLTNNGTIDSKLEGSGDPNDRILNGNITNSSTGLINVQAPLVFGANPPLNSTLHNQGMIELGSQQTFVVPDGESSTVFNDTGGQISNGGGSGLLGIGAQNTFNEGGGTTMPATATAANPPVVIDGSNLGATLKYTGTGASTVYARNKVTLNGSLAHGQNLVVQGNTGGCPESLVTSASGFTNAGTITLLGNCSSGIKTTTGTFTNTGTLVVKSGANRELKGNLSTSGTLNIQAPLAFDGSGATLTQTGGTTTISPSQYIDLTGSSDTFHLNGGLLQSPGSNSTHQGGITGSLNNSGGNVAPGSPTAPGDFSISGHYSQGASGKLTAVLNGTHAGTTYSQLGVVGGSTLGGTLNIVTHSGFHPAAGNLFSVLGGSIDSGKFATLIGQFPAGGIGYKPLYDASDMTLQATADAKLTVTKAGSGTVTSSPSGINCGTTCSALFFKPQTVTLTEHPSSGHTFKGWSGACTGKTTTCKVKMTKAQSVTATFS